MKVFWRDIFFTGFLLVLSVILFLYHINSLGKRQHCDKCRWSRNLPFFFTLNLLMVQNFIAGIFQGCFANTYRGINDVF